MKLQDKIKSEKKVCIKWGINQFSLSSTNSPSQAGGEWCWWHQSLRHNWRWRGTDFAFSITISYPIHFRNSTPKYATSSKWRKPKSIADCIRIGFKKASCWGSEKEKHADFETCLFPTSKGNLFMNILNLNRAYGLMLLLLKGCSLTPDLGKGALKKSISFCLSVTLSLSHTDTHKNPLSSQDNTLRQFNIRPKQLLTPLSPNCLTFRCCY